MHAQARYAYDLAGEIIPLVGCVETNDTPEGLTLKYDFRRFCSCVPGRTDNLNVQGVGRLGPYHAMTHADSQHNHAVIVISRTPLLAADIILILVTWAKLRDRRHLREIGQSNRMSLSNILFQDGMSFCATGAHDSDL